MANKEREVAMTSEAGREIDSQIVITLYKGEREPEARCTQAGRLTGQMIMGLEGANMMRIDNELRRAQLELRRSSGQLTPENRRGLIERIMQTKENSSGGE